MADIPKPHPSSNIGEDYELRALQDDANHTPSAPRPASPWEGGDPAPGMNPYYSGKMKY